MPLPGTITCFLCGGTHIYPGPRFEAHLQNEHGAIFSVDFLVSVSLHKQNYSSLPLIGDSAVTPPRSVVDDEPGQVDDTLGLDVSVQTETGPALCSRCNDPMVDMKDEPTEDSMDEDMMGVGSDDEMNIPSHFMSEGNLKSCWLCPICPMVYKRQSYFKQHMTVAHEVAPEDTVNMTSVELTEEEFQKRQQAAVSEREGDGVPLLVENSSSQNCYAVDKAKRKVVGKEWAPNSFSSRFTCMFCNEQFRKDYKLKLHLMMVHKDQPPDLMEKAKEELIKAKLDGCVHKCGLCGNKYNSIANFTRHIKDVHNMSRNDYKQEYGESEVVSRMFRCELCNKEVKHTRNIIGAHMKMVHLVSWKEYQDIILKLKSGEGSIDMPTPELFDCIICGVSVKYKREHLNKKHQLDEDVYEELIAKKNRGEDITADLPDREIFSCLICERECMDFKRHLQVCHKLTEEQYMQEFCNGEAPQVKIVKQPVFDESENPQDCDGASVKVNQVNKIGNVAVSPGKKAKKVKKEKDPEQEPLSTDLQCYFECEEVFKKDYQLFLHLKLRHRNEDPDELEKAYEAANEEIALTRRSASLFNCALCPRVFNDNGAFYGHIQNKHEISYRDYKDKYGRCETESSPFECKICAKIIKYDRNTVHTHLKNVHGINWTKYLDRVRRVRRGLEPEPLPTMKTTECRICNVSVKYVKEHLKNAHKITEKEYDELFSDDNDSVISKKKKVKTSVDEEESPPYKRPRKEIRDSSDNFSHHSFYSGNNSDSGQVDYVDSSSMDLMTPKLEPVVDLKVEKPPKADIQNKSNKTCSVCKITFDIRKTFIEHCQLTHGMKFKTKSGLSIPPPSMMHHTQTEDDDGHENDDLSGNMDNEMERSNGESRRDSLQSSESGELIIAEPVDYQKIDPWNRCQFQCAICPSTTAALYTDRRNIKSHVVTTHKLLYSQYLAQYGDPEIPTPKWVCGLCGSETRHARNNIYIHLRDCHSLTCDQYSAQYGLPGENDSLIRASTPVSNKESAIQFSSKWNKCRFICPLCSKVFNEKRHIRTHAQQSHSTSLDMLEAQHGDSEVHTEYFFCAVCHAEVKHCHRNILMHLQRSHNLNTTEYEAKYGEVEPNSVEDDKENPGVGQHFLITDHTGQLLTPPDGSGGGTSKSVGRVIKGVGSVPCENCGKKFSNLSNKERHKREHCAAMLARSPGIATAIKKEVVDEVLGEEEELERVPPLRIKLGPSPIPQSSDGIEEEGSSAEESDDDFDSKVEVIDETTVSSHLSENEDHFELGEDVPIGVIINESNESLSDGNGNELVTDEVFSNDNSPRLRRKS